MRTSRIGSAGLALLLVATASCVRSNEGALIVEPLAPEDVASSTPGGTGESSGDGAQSAGAQQASDGSTTGMRTVR